MYTFLYLISSSFFRSEGRADHHLSTRMGEGGGFIKGREIFCVCCVNERERKAGVV